jgi:hydrogenase nickel incorporation protein HypA/HybF
MTSVPAVQRFLHIRKNRNTLNRKGRGGLHEVENMHEVTIAENLLETALAHMRENGGHSITRIRVDVGHLSGVVPEALEFAFSCLKEQTPAETADLEINALVPEYLCAGCGQTIQPAGQDEMIVECPFCESRHLTVVKGYELNLSEMEIETDE